MSFTGPTEVLSSPPPVATNLPKSFSMPETARSSCSSLASMNLEHHRKGSSQRSKGRKKKKSSVRRHNRDYEGTARRTFDCYSCIKRIRAHRPIYLRNDFTYCSRTCRERGVSELFGKFARHDGLTPEELDNLSVRQLGILRSKAVDVCAAMAVQAITVSAMRRYDGGGGDPGIAARTYLHPEDYSTGAQSADRDGQFDDDEEAAAVEAEETAREKLENQWRDRPMTIMEAAQARARMMIHNLARRLSSNALVSRAVNTYSTSREWGQELTKNTSVGMLFSYLPELQGPTLPQDRTDASLAARVELEQEAAIEASMYCPVGGSSCSSMYMDSTMESSGMFRDPETYLPSQKRAAGASLSGRTVSIIRLRDEDDDSGPAIGVKAVEPPRRALGIF
ncbi:hypothetical protein FOZ63_026603 [Perkinsus olseni]|uniref:Uncharacterized protein n=1 Tax=Perkinsus olseni TaxID=32597 RepID=A0A7J6PIG5_PEROL|nr:hypothetical protein FOZ60_005155 [Perkinsus olseni]KAF4723475.1 hypothetical protein FOZ63_026603 [Perkinsus olseni]